MGAKLRFYLLGGHTVNANALLRFYVLHTMMFPLLVIMLIAVHLWRLHEDGGMYDLDEQGKPDLARSQSAGDGDLSRSRKKKRLSRTANYCFEKSLASRRWPSCCFDGVVLEGSAG